MAAQMAGAGGASWVNARYVFVYTCLCHSVPVFSFVRWRYRLLLPAFAFIFLHPRGPDHWSPLSWGRRACPGYRYCICSTFFARPPSCSCPKSAPSLPLGVFPFRFNSPQSSNSFFPSFFSPTSISASSWILSCQLLLSSLLPLSFLWVTSLILSFFSRLLSIHPPFYLHPLSRRFPPIITDFTSSATSSPSLPSPCYTALQQLNRWKTQLSSVLSHPCFLLAFYKTPGHRKAAIYHGRGATPRDTKAFEAVINLKHVGGMFQSVEERVRKHSAPCSPWQDCRWHTEPGSDPGLISGMWFLPKA